MTLLNDQTVFGNEEWHGTVVASVAAAPVNGVGIVGVYPQAALQIWDASPVSDVLSFSAATGIETVAQHCPAVISLSVGSRSPSVQIANAIVDAQHRGCLVVASAGNGGQRGSPPSYPAAQAHVLTVAATDQNDTVADFSSASPSVDLAAPGVGIVGAVPLSTTRPGSPPSTGRASRRRSSPRRRRGSGPFGRRSTGRQLFQLIRSTARDVGPPGFDPETGFGILDIPAALAAPDPPRDPLEPNDDIVEVRPGPLQQPPITTPTKPSIRISGTVDANEDPHDLYRIWIPARQVVHVAVAAGGNAAARIWGPLTVSVGEGLAARRRDLHGTQMSGGTRGTAAYVDVFPTGKSVGTSYVLSVRASRS